MLRARRQSSNKLYGTYLLLWKTFCSQRDINMYKATVAQGLNFLQTLVTDNKGYSAVNTARSALSSVLRYGGTTFGQQPDVQLFMKGVYNQRPPVPRYTRIWDVDVVLVLLKAWSPADKLTLDKLTMKVVVLLLLVTGQRPQIFRGLRVDQMEVSGSSFVFDVDNSCLKQGRLGYKLEPIRLVKYAPDRRLCIYRYLTVYLRRTLDHRAGHKQLILTCKKPYGPATVNTIARWIKLVLKEAGVNVGEYKPGSVRHASTSMAKAQGVPIGEILASGGWSGSSVFAKYYNKPIEGKKQFANKVLGDKH
jgi:integrase